MTSVKFGKMAGKRAIAALMSTAIATTGIAVVNAPIASAIEAPADNTSALGNKPKNTGNGQGDVTTVGTVQAGGILTVEGTNFVERPADGFVSFLLEDGNVDSPAQGTDGSNLTGAGRSVDLPKTNWTDKNSFTAKIKLPSDLKPGKYFYRVLAGNDGGTPASRVVWFEVAEATNVVAAQASASNPSATGVTVAGNGFTADSAVTATVNGKAAKFRAGRGTADSAKATAEGTVSGNLVFDEGTVPATTTGTVVLKDAAGKEATATFTGVANVSAASANEDGSGTGRASGGTGNYTVSNLPAGAQVTHIGTEKNNWISAAVTADDKGVAAANGVKIPETSVAGEGIIVKYTVAGKSYTHQTGLEVAPSESTKGVENFEITKKDLKSGLYQVAYSAKENAIYVSRAVGRPPVKESSIFKLNADTLEVIQEINPAVQNEETGARWAAYGLSVDDKNGVLWVTNTRQNTVSAYKTSDLSLIKQWEAGSSNHGRDVIVDQTTGKAYVSTPRGGHTIDVYTVDGGKVETIDLAEVPDPMSLALDQKTGELFTVSLTKPKAAKIDVRNGNKVTSYDLPENRAASPSGVAWDPENRNLYIANQGTSNVLVLDVDNKKVIADLPAGGGALNVVYEPVNKVVVSTNRTGGTATVIDAKTVKVVGNLNIGKFGNHATVDGRGNIYLVNKAGVENADGERFDQVFKITQKVTEKPDTNGSLDGSKPGAEGSKPGTEGSKPGADGSQIGKEDSPLMVIIGILSAIGGLAIVGHLVREAINHKLIDRNALPPVLRAALGI